MNDIRSQPERVYVIEKTAKRWKAMQAYGVVLLLASAVVMLACGKLLSVSPRDIGAIAIMVGGGLTAVTGLVFYVVGRFAGWWFHG